MESEEVNTEAVKEEPKMTSEFDIASLRKIVRKANGELRRQYKEEIIPSLEKNKADKAEGRADDAALTLLAKKDQATWTPEDTKQFKSLVEKYVE